MPDDVRSKKRSKKAERDENDDDVAYGDGVLVCGMASVINIGKNHSGVLTGMVTFDISKDARIPVAIDGLIKIHADGIHETSEVRGKREDEQGSLVLRSGYLHRAAKKGWI